MWRVSYNCLPHLYHVLVFFVNHLKLCIKVSGKSTSKKTKYQLCGWDVHLYVHMHVP